MSLPVLPRFSRVRYVIEPYHEFPNLLDILFSFLKTEQPSGVKREVHIYISPFLSHFSSSAVVD